MITNTQPAPTGQSPVIRAEKAAVRSDTTKTPAPAKAADRLAAGTLWNIYRGDLFHACQSDCQHAA
jgi:hypothetical protein